MRKAAISLMLLLLIAPLASSRSVHSAEEVDLLPHGGLNDASKWQIINQQTWDASSPSEYTTGTLIDSEFKITHSRQLNSDVQTRWATGSSTNSNASKGAPDGAYTWSNGPDIILSGFGMTGYDQYPLLSAQLIVAFVIPGTLHDDTIRFSIEDSGTFDLVKTWAHTTSRIDYVNGSHWSYELTADRNWTWSELESLEVKLDYVSSAPDDTRLEVDAVGIRVEMQTPWNGIETSKAVSSYTPEMWPIIELDLTTGQRDGLSLGVDGLSPSSNGTTGTWTSDVIEVPPQQSFGRIHADADLIEFSSSDDGETWSGFSAITSAQILDDTKFLKVRLSENDRTISAATLDINDPTLTISGSIAGTYDGIASNYSTWFARFNGNVIATGDIDQNSTIDVDIPIGAHINPQEDFEIEIGAQVSWTSDGLPASFDVVFERVELSGGYEVLWDENPTCLEIQDLDFVEDGGGLLLPINPRCQDDRTAKENLSISVTSSDEEILVADVVDDQMRVRLVDQASGTVVITITVSDVAGNTWTQDVVASVANIDDEPQIDDFPPLVQIELGEESKVAFAVEDLDTAFDELSFSADLSWAEIDIASRQIILNPPTTGYHTVIFSACDDTQCVTSSLDLEVRSLPDLLVEKIEVEGSTTDSLTPGDVVRIDVFVRNSGKAEANLVSVRCMESDSLISYSSIATLQVGDIGKVSCDWQVPSNLEVAMIRGIVDNSQEIDESIESNNEMELLLKVEGSSAISVDGDGASSSLPTSLTLTGAGILLLLITILFMAFAPAKIRKVE